MPTWMVQPSRSGNLTRSSRRWLLEQVKDSVRLTQAGYLPPAIVSADDSIVQSMPLRQRCLHDECRRVAL